MKLTQYCKSTTFQFFKKVQRQFIWGAILSTNGTGRAATQKEISLDIYSIAHTN